MAYVPTVWENDITEVDEDNMNHIEEGIKNNDDKLQGLASMGSIVVDSIRSKNIFNENWALGSINVSDGSINPDNASNSIVSANLIPVKPNTTYVISFSGGNYTIDRIAYFNSSGTFISRSDSLGVTTFTTDANTYFIRFNIWLSGITPSAVGNTQLEEGTATSYSSYQGLGYVSGSNLNGNYIKYADGTLIQYGVVSKNVTITNSSTHGGYFDNGYSVNLPTSFIDGNYFVEVTCKSYDNPTMKAYAIGSSQPSIFQFGLSSNDSFSKTGVSFSWLAVGRWY